MPAFVGGMPESQTGDPTTAGSWVGCWNCIDQAPEKSDIAEIVRPAAITSKGVLKS
jgi:predicted aldo/keto reductase-like oxidoreductase